MTQELQPHPLRGLLVPGTRLGWEFQQAQRQPFTQAQPVPPAPTQPDFDTAAARNAMWRRLVMTVGIGGVVTVVVGCCGLVAGGPAGSTDIGSSLTLMATVLALGTVALIVWTVVGYRTQVSRATGFGGAARSGYQRALQVWQQQAAFHEAAETARLAALP